VQPLLALTGKSVASPRAVPVAAIPNTSLGVFRVGSPGSATSDRFYLLAGLAGGFALLAGLFLLLFVRRRAPARVPYGWR